MFAARRDHIKEVILPALERGAVVLCDRFTDSSWAYQGGGRGFDPHILGQLESWVQEGVKPHITVWFDLPPQVAADRRSAVRAADRFESQDLTFFEAVRRGYAQRAEGDPERFLRVDAHQPVESVWSELKSAMDDKMHAIEDLRQKRRMTRP